MNFIMLILVIVVLGWRSTGFFEGNVGAEELKIVEGKWEIIKIVHLGNSQTIKGGFWTFTNGKLTYGSGNYDLFKMDATKKPGTMDILVLSHGKKPFALSAVFQRRGDQLEICVRIIGSGRPSNFESKKTKDPGDGTPGHRLIVLRKLKENKGDKK